MVPEIKYRRPRKLTPALTRTICGYLVAGASVRDTCVLAGISLTTFYRWCDAGRLPDAELKHRRFVQSVERARADWKTARLEGIQSAGRQQRKVRVHERVTPDGETTRDITVETSPGDWRADAWLLERRFPEEFAGATQAPERPVRKVRLDVVAPGNRAVRMVRGEDGAMTMETVEDAAVVVEG